VPATVTIPAGQTSATFPVAIVDDSRIDGPVTVTIAAQVANWTGGSSNITVADNETTDLVVTLPAFIREGDAPTTGTVRISGTRQSDLTVALGSSDTTELTVPASVVIPAGQTTATFMATAVNDTDADGSQNATVTASATGFTSGGATIAVHDNDAHHFTLGPIAGPVLRNSQVPITVTAKDINDATITNYNQAVGFGAADSGAANIPVTPAGATGFVNGVLSTNVGFGAYGTGVILTVADTGGHQGTSNSFDVIVGPLARFEWNPIASPRFVDSPFPVTIRATDVAGNPVPTYAGSPSLSAPLPDTLQILTWTAFADVASGGEYTNTKQAIAAHFPGYSETATTTTDPAVLSSQLAGKQVFLIVEQENANDTNLGTIGSSWTSVLTNFVNGGGTVIVCSHLRAEHLLLTNSGLLNATPITSFDSTQVTKTADTPLNAGVVTPFTGAYIHSYSSTNGTTSLLTSGTQSVVLSRDIGAGRVVLIGTDYFTIGTPMDRVIANAVALAQPASNASLPVSPSTAGPFVNGQWNGNVSVPFVRTSVRLRASDGAIKGDSNVFDVQAATPPGGVATVFAEDFESGVLNPAFWTSTGIGPFRTQVSTLFTPHGGTRHLTMDSSLDGTDARNEATLTVNLAGRTGVVLKFWAAGYNDEASGPPPSPFIGGANFDGVAISADGNTWWEVQGLRSLPSTYGLFTVDLDAAIASRGLTYNTSFKIRFNQFDNFSLTTDGIVVDDILITAFAPSSSLTVTLPAQVNEGAGPVAASVSVSAPQAADLVISLSSKSPSKITVPSTVTIPAGQTSAAFSMTVLDDSFVDGLKNVVITAVSSGYLESGATVQVVDNDGGALTLNLPATVSENAGSVVGTLNLGVPSLLPQTVSLSSSIPAALQVPATLTIPTGATSVNVPLTVTDDTIIDGDQTVRISATLSGWTSGSADVVVVDNENRNLSVSIPGSFRETDSPKIGTVSLNGIIATDLVVSLASSDISEITVPASVLIPAGQSSATFTITVQDDTLGDGPQPFTITASAATFVSGSASGVVRDDEAHHFTFASIGSPQIRGGPVPAIVTARDPSGAVIADYSSTITLSATGSSGPLTVIPSSGSGFVNGTWNGSVQINTLATGVVLTASDSLGHSGSSNSFDLVDGQISRFAWDPVPASQSVDNPFSVTIRAVDAAGSTVAGYNGIANLAVLSASEDATIGKAESSEFVPIYTAVHDSRTTILYRAPELGGSNTIAGLAMNVTSRGPVPETLTNWTIRMKHVTQPNLLNMNVWDNAGWTTVYRASPTISATGWVTFVFTTPFTYDGTQNLLIDFSMDRAATNSYYTYVQSSYDSEPMMRYGGSNSTNGDPLTWVSSPSPSSIYSRPDIRLTTVKEVPIRPPLTGAFVSGVWAGSISVPIAVNNAMLKARAGTVMGTSNALTVVPSPPPSTGDANVFIEDFESGVLDPSYWTITGTGNYRTINTTLNGPRGTRHLTMDSSTTSLSRNEATLTLNLAGRSGVSLKFWAKEFSDLAHGPPPSPFPSTGADFDGVAISADGGLNWYEVQPLRTLTGAYAQLTVDLDAAIATRGLSYGNNFKIRFNQYDSDYIPFRGIAIDDIAVTANPVSGFTFTVPGQVPENAGNLPASVTLAAAAGTDTVITLNSSATAKIAVPPSVTVPTGQTTASFSLSVIDDSIADGDRIVGITGTMGGSIVRGALIKVLDNDSLPITLTAPATVTEGTTGQTATVALGAGAAGAITVNLASSDTTELTVPASIVIQPGQKSITFPVTVVNDTLIDGPQTVIITASVSGWQDATAMVQVADNENRNLVISSALTAYEGQTVSGSVSISGTLPNSLVVTLTSSNPAQFTVPTSVTIPAGQTTVSITGTAVDDTATDGTQSVTITATAPTFNNGTATAWAYDNDVHHFGFSTISSPKLTGTPFSVTITARDIDNFTITPFNGTVSLSAAGDGGTVAITPTATGLFSSGSWFGNVSCNTARTNVRITATAGGVSSSSNPFDVQLSPTISISPTSISATVAQGASTTRDLTISNIGGGTLLWSLDSGTALAEVTAEGPVFSDGIIVPKEQGTESPGAIPPLDPSRIYSEPRSEDEIIESISSVPLASILTNLNSNSGLVRNAIPNRYPFSEGVTGTSISDGGNDMYDGGNILNTNLGTFLPYSDSVIVSSALLGTGGRYFTRKYDGLWVFAADVAGLTNFDITGDLGADGSGATDSAVLSLVRDGITYKGFVKRVYNAGDPSVNHLIIVADNGTVTHQVSTDTNNDYHRLTNLSGVTRVYYLLYAGSSGAYIANASALSIMTAFLDAVSAPNWVTAFPSSGNVVAGSPQTVTLTLSAANLAAGTYNRTVLINSNDPATPLVSLPVTLTVLGVPSLAVSPATGLSASGFRGGPFTPANQIFALSNPGPQPLNWTVTKTANWLDVSPASGTLNPGATINVNAALNASANSLASGPYSDTLVFTNTTNGVGNTTRPVSLTVNPAGELAVTPADGLISSGPYGGPFTPASKAYTLTNTGDAPINWSAAETAPWLTLSSASGALAPGGSAVVTATIAAATTEPGSYSHNIAFTNTSNGRGDTTRNVALEVILPAPVLGPEPPITPGTLNTISWNAVAGADAYEAQISQDPAFTVVTGSGPITTISHTFTGLTDGTQYYYRVRARRDFVAQSSVWSQTSQADFTTGAASNVNLTSVPGSVVLETAAAATWTENFDEPGSSFSSTIFPDLITSWDRLPLSTATYPNTSPGLPINQGGDLEATGLGGGFMTNVASNRFVDGVIEGYLFPTQTNTAVGLTLRGQKSPLQGYVAKIRRLTTGACVVEFSVYGFPGVIAASPQFSFTPPNEHFKLRFTASGSTLRVDLWRVAVTGGVVTETPVILENGVNSIIRTGAVAATGVAGIYALMSGTDLPAIDDVSVVATSGLYVSSGTLTSPPISPVQWQRWGALTYTKNTSAAGTGLTVDVLNAAGVLLAPNVVSGTDLNSIASVANQPSIRLRTNLSTTNPSNTPRLDDWSVQYSTAVSQTFYSGWSNVETSTQFNAPPTITAIDDQAFFEDGMTALLPFNLGDDTTLPDSLVLSVFSSNPALVPVSLVQLGGIGANRTIQVATLPDQYGSAEVTIRVTDEGGKSTDEKFTVAVASVNDKPRFTPGTDQTVIEDAGPQTVPGWATQISPGPSNEGDQAVDFVVTNDNATLFAAAPAIAPNGTLTYTPAADANGTATITVRLHDSGGVTNGGNDTSDLATFRINVAAVNDRPTFAPSADQTVIEDDGLQTVPGWATQISAGPANESGQTLNFIVSNDNAALFAAAPAIAPNGTLMYTPAADANGTATITVRLHDNGDVINGGNDTSDSATFRINVTAVNDAPSFVKGSDQTARQNAGVQTVAEWAMQISKGPADEAAQTLEFHVTTNHPELFEVPPAISPNGTLTFTPAAAVSGTAAVTVKIRDDGGTENGGVDTSEPQTFTISTIFTNDAPTFVAGSDIQIGNDAGPQSYTSWAKEISPGPADEAGQTLDFRVTVDNPSLFAALPSIAPDGTLTFTPAPAASGTATVLVQLHDNGGIENGGVDLSEMKSFRIAITTFIEEAGSYNGLVSATDGIHPSANHLGLIRVNINLRGAFSGKLTIGGRTAAFKGQVDSAGVAHFAPNNTASLAITRPNQPALTAEFKIDVANETDSLTGTVSEGNSPFAVISASRSLYSANPEALPPYSPVPDEMLGSYTLILGDTTPIDAQLPAVQYPHGNGSGVLKVSKSGSVRMTALLPDGTKVAYGSGLSKANAFPLYYGSRRGYAIGGFVTFRDVPQVSDVDGLGLVWFRPSGPGVYYPGGWPGGLTTNLVGSKFNRPARGSYVFENMSPADGDGNAVMSLHDGDLPAVLEQRLNIMPDHAVRVIAPNSSKVQLRIDARTGLFHGKLRYPQSGASKIRGALLQKQRRGAGSFQTKTEAGGIIVMPN
jgi:hypothetical protein